MSNSTTDLAKGPKDTERLTKIDFKMISFTLAGKDYGIDILKVKEIRKAGNFTKVPNTPVYVRGVDNLRGDIIPIIDLRTMFNLPAETKDKESQENIVILRLESLVLGIIVDTIEKVVGFASESIQPPHPIFGDINIKYISGVVENAGRLYIILDVDRIFGETEAAPPSTASVDEPAPSSAVSSVQEGGTEGAAVPLDLQFVGETLAAFGQFHLSSLNREWVSSRLQEWKKSRKDRDLDFQLTQKDEAEEFLATFASPSTGRIWTSEMTSSLADLLSFPTPSVVVWNPGCGRGYEAYSLAMVFQSRFPEKAYKVWASDNDLLSISTAPSLILEEDEVEGSWKSYTVQSKNGLQFNSDIKARIVFEFHDLNHLNPLSDVHLVVIRDVISYLKPSDQDKLLTEISEKVRPGGYLLLGCHERLEHPEWKPIGNEIWSVYQKI
jgi:chemotaxis signal transduction protein/chemotaxis methyl-accepting protein methylase